jgi:DNA-directed RNA polymerase subunit RPC12/RpoP
MNMQKRKCMECGEEFERDMDNPKVIRAYEQMGALADQCPKCLRKMVEEESA